MKLLQTNTYLLLIDEEAEIQKGDLMYDNHLVGLCNCTKVVNKLPYSYTSSFLNVDKVIAYYPLNSEAKELDLLLLPNPFKSNYKHPFYALLSAIDILKSDGFDERCDVLVHLEETKNFIQNVMQSKQFNLEDINKAIAFGFGICRKEDRAPFNLEIIEFIQSLSTQQLPKEFVISDKFSTFEENIKNGKYKW